MKSLIFAFTSMPRCALLKLIFLPLTLALILVPGGSAKAQGLDTHVETPAELKQRYEQTIDKTLYDTYRVGGPCNVCSVKSADEVEQGCLQTYNKLYSKPVVDMRIFFSYMDSYGYRAGSAAAQTEDRYLAQTLISQLITSPCPNGKTMCGFDRSPDDATLFTKEIIGPDGQTHTIKLTVASSSASDNDVNNRGSGPIAAIQKNLTARNKALYVDGVKNADVLLYAGHMRKGGAPDFGPPILDPKTQTPDYAQYQRNKNQLGYGQLMSTLRSSPKKPQIIGLLACDAELYAGQDLRNAAPNSGIILGGSVMPFESIFAETVATLDSVLSMRCADKFDQSLNAMPVFNNQKITPVHLTNFFHDSPSRGPVDTDLNGAATTSVYGDPNNPYTPPASRLYRPAPAAIETYRSAPALKDTGAAPASDPGLGGLY